MYFGNSMGIDTMKIIVLIMSFLVSAVSPLFARPPSEIIVDYKITQKLLVVSVKHPTHDFNHDYIKKIVVIKDGEKPQVSLFADQRDSKEQTLEIALEAKPLERIKVQAQCKEGGIKETEFIVPSEEEIKP